MTPLRALTALALAVALAVAVPARAQDDEPGPDYAAPPAEQYEPSLAPYGTWYPDPTYGRVWRPAVGVGWAPYADGRWVWTTWGWTWMSWEPWAWTFHYGRWGWAPAYGWFWVPGTVWGPAWVDWVWGDGYVGWAPLAPWGRPVLVNNYFWVRERDFCAPRVHGYMVHGNHLPPYVRQHWHQWRGRAPARAHVEHVSRFVVPREHQMPRQTVAPWQRGRPAGEVLGHARGGSQPGRDGGRGRSPFPGRAGDGTLQHRPAPRPDPGPGAPRGDQGGGRWVHGGRPSPFPGTAEVRPDQPPALRHSNPAAPGAERPHGWATAPRSGAPMEHGGAFATGIPPAGTPGRGAGAFGGGTIYHGAPGGSAMRGWAGSGAAGAPQRGGGTAPMIHGSPGGFPGGGGGASTRGGSGSGGGGAITHGGPGPGGGGAMGGGAPQRGGGPQGGGRRGGGHAMTGR